MSEPGPDTAISPPAAALRSFVRCYAGFRANGIPGHVDVAAPSSDINLLISLGEPIELARMPSATQAPAAFRALVGGLRETPVHIRRNRETLGVHVFVRPLGVRAILGVSSAEIASSTVHLSDIWGVEAEHLVDRLRAANSWRQRFDILDLILTARLNPHAVSSSIVWAWRRLQVSHGRLSVQHLADEIGYSRRHLGELFKDAVGVTPKSAARVLRFERACRLIRDFRASLADVAAASGYFDQAHMTREWNALAGYSPKAWIALELPNIQDYEIKGHNHGLDDEQD